MNETKQPCRGPSGSFRAYFNTREEAEAFAQDPANTAYHGDIAHPCHCGFYHLSQPSWLEPQLTHRDAKLLEEMGIAGPKPIPGGMKRARCGIGFREIIDLFIRKDGSTVCETCNE